MSTYRIGSTFRQPVLADPQYAVAAAMSITNGDNPTMSDALSSTSLYSERSIIMFHSTRLSARLGFIISGNIGKIATRIQKLANPPKSSKPNPGLLKEEIVECLGRLAWGYDNLTDGMRSVEECVFEWCGGGFSRPRSNEEIEQVAAALSISVEQARASAETNRQHTKDYLTIRRQNLGPVMVTKIEQLLEDFSGEQIEPDLDMLESSMDAVFKNAILWGDWAEAKLVQADAVDWLGKSLSLPNADKSQADKAGRIREELANRQAQLAQNETANLVAFNLDDVSDTNSGDMGADPTELAA